MCLPCVFHVFSSDLHVFSRDFSWENTSGDHLKKTAQRWLPRCDGWGPGGTAVQDHRTQGHHTSATRHATRHDAVMVKTGCFFERFWWFDILMVCWKTSTDGKHLWISILLVSDGKDLLSYCCALCENYLGAFSGMIHENEFHKPSNPSNPSHPATLRQWTPPAAHVGWSLVTTRGTSTIIWENKEWNIRNNLWNTFLVVLLAPNIPEWS